MAINANGATRAPRGTKTLTQAFFSAADDIPEAQRQAVVKAALTAIRDQLKNGRDKAKAAKAAAKAKLGRAPMVRRPKLSATAPQKAPAAAPVAAKPRGRPGRKPAHPAPNGSESP